MKIEDRLKKRMFDNGLFPAQADQVMEIVKADVANGVMVGRWEEDEEVYPSAIMALDERVKSHVIEWMDKECPRHWARAMFE